MSISSLLTHCPGCESALIQVEMLDSRAETTRVARRCPECSYQDELDLPSAVADLLGQRASELGDCLYDLADRLEMAAELWIYDPL
jgi:hypothetical protein